MSDKKNIDRLFQEKFKDFEADAPIDSWANIEAKLDGKKKRRVIPFWWKLSGVAAVFLIGFLVSKSIYDSGEKLMDKNPVVNQNNSDAKDKTTIEDVNVKHIKENVIPTDPSVSEQAKQNRITNDANTNSSDKNNISTNEKGGSNIASTAIATTSQDTKNNVDSNRKNSVKKAVISSESTVAERKSSRHRSLKNKSNGEKENAPIPATAFEKSQNQVAQNQKNTNQSINNNKSTAEKDTNGSEQSKQIVKTNSNEKSNKETQNSVDQKNINLDDLKGNVNSKIATKEIEKKVNDTAKKSGVATNELEELLNEKESKSKDSKKNRWQLASNVAPIFLGSVSNGSPIDSTLSNNSKSYNTNVGFGIGVSYAVNKKLSIRTGLNKVNMSYDTNNISFFTGIQAKTLQGVKPVASSAMIHVENNAAPSNAELASESSLLPFENTFVHKSSGYLRQEMGYLEMPVEMTYNLVDKKFGLKIIGGFSTMFLQDNSIMIISEGRDTFLGEANNLNDVHFSTNLGLGIKYNFMKSFEFNVEPTFKYQINTYNANAGNFKPYLFGIYSGISYKF
jgi:hypothetical protein